MKKEQIIGFLACYLSVILVTYICVAYVIGSFNIFSYNFEQRLWLVGIEVFTNALLSWLLVVISEDKDEINF